MAQPDRTLPPAVQKALAMLGGRRLTVMVNDPQRHTASREVLREIRRRLLLSQAEIAERCGVSQQAVSAWKRGRRQPALYGRRALLKLLAEAGVEPRYQEEDDGQEGSAVEGRVEWGSGSADLRELVRVYGSLPPAARKEVLAFSRFKAARG